jgi:hypothetical protein
MLYFVIGWQFGMAESIGQKFNVAPTLAKPFFPLLNYKKEQKKNGFCR